MLIVSIICGAVAFLIVWKCHHAVREKLVSLFVLRDRSLSWQAAERIIASAVVAICAASTGAYLFWFFFPAPQTIDDNASYSILMPDTFSTGENDFNRKGDRNSSGSPGDYYGDSLDSALGAAGPEEKENLGAESSAGRPLIFVKKNFDIVLKGRIGDKYQILMEMKSADRVLSGVYYDEVRMMDFRFDGDVARNGTCQVRGHSMDGSHAETFEGIFNNRSFKGTWKDNKEMQELPFLLTAVKKEPLLRALGKRIRS